MAFSSKDWRQIRWPEVMQELRRMQAEIGEAERAGQQRACLRCKINWCSRKPPD
jgi:hypothetical protein